MNAMKCASKNEVIVTTERKKATVKGRIIDEATSFVDNEKSKYNPGGTC